VPGGADVKFTPNALSSDLKSSKTLVIESFNVGVDKSKGNLNGAGNEAAAYRLVADWYRDNYNSQKLAVLPVEQREKLQRIIGIAEWVKWADNGYPALPAEKQRVFEEKLAAVNIKTLAEITKAFYGIQLKYPDPKDANAMLAETLALFDFVVDHNPASEELKQRYAAELSSKAAHDQANLNKLRETIQTEPNRQRSYSYANGLSCVSIDVRGTGIDAGAGAAYTGETTPDYFVFLADEVDDYGNKIGEKVSIKYPRGATGQGNIVDLLGDRLGLSEKLFGRGYKFTTDSGGYGGHEGIVSSPAWVGTGLDAENILSAFEEFNTVPRYSPEDFKAKIAETFSQLGVENYTDPQLQSPENALSIGEHSVEVAISLADGSRRKIDLSESDLPIYTKVLSGLDASNRQEVLAAKTASSEHLLITQARLESGRASLEQVLSSADGKGTTVLSIINGLNEYSLNKLPPALLMQAWQRIAADKEAVNQVWDKTNERFVITSPVMPDWLKDNIIQQQEAKYTLDSAVHKTDSVITDKLLQTVLAEKDEQAQMQLAQSFVQLLTGLASLPASQIAPDRLLENAVKLATATETDVQTRSYLREQLTLLEANPALAVRWELLRTKTPQYYGAFAELKEGNFMVEGRPAIADLESKALGSELVNASVERQLKVDGKAYVTVLAEVGNRNVKNLFLRSNVRTQDDATVEGTTSSLHAEFKVPRWLDMRQESKELDEFCEITSRQFLDYIFASGLLGKENVNFRFIMGSLPSTVTFRIGSLIAGGISDVKEGVYKSLRTNLDPASQQELEQQIALLTGLKNRVVYCAIEQNNKDFVDRKLL